MSKAPQARKELTNFRLEPQMKYIAEIAARVQRKNLTSYLEWAFEQSFKQVELEKDVFLAEKIGDLWDFDEADRFLKLAYSYPALLTYEESRILKAINENFHFFKKDKSNVVFSESETEQEFDANIPKFKFIDLKKFRDNWEHLKDYSEDKVDLNLS